MRFDAKSSSDFHKIFDKVNGEVRYGKSQFEEARREYLMKPIREGLEEALKQRLDMERRMHELAAQTQSNELESEAQEDMTY